MRVALNALVHTKDGKEIGRLQAAVVSPSKNQVDGFAVDSTSSIGRDVIIPLDEIEAASDDGGAIDLRLSRDEVDTLPGYLPTNYVAGPSDADVYGPHNLASDVFGSPSPFRHASEEWEDSGGPVDAPPYGGMETDIEDQRNETMGIPQEAPVFDVKGNRAGTVEDVLVDTETGRLNGIVIHLANTGDIEAFGENHVQLDRSAIDRVRSEGVYLRITTEEVRRQNEKHL
jgi:sporulation protein YlmC with PRC-barrel domain